MALSGADIMRQALSAGRFDSVQTQAFTHQQINKAAVESGQAMGLNLQVMEDPLADLIDSMEELSFQFEEKEMKTAGERKLGERIGPRSAYITAIQGWMKVLPDMPGGEFMERMLRQLRQRQAAGEQTTGGQLLKMLGEGSDDPTHQFAMLETMEKALGEGDGGLLELLTAAKRELTEAKGAEIRAGINLADAVNEQASGPEEMKDLRNLYRSETIGFKGPQDCFRSLLATRGAARLADSIAFLIKGCGIDLQSPSPSQGAEELRTILADLQCVNVLAAVLDSCTKLAGKMSSQFAETCLLNGERMTGKVMDFTEMPFVTAANVAAFVTTCGIAGLLARIYFCTELTRIFRSLSPRLFGDEGDRFKLIDAAQEHLDGLVLEQSAEDERNQREGRAAS